MMYDCVGDEVQDYFDCDIDEYEIDEQLDWYFWVFEDQDC